STSRRRGTPRHGPYAPRENVFGSSHVRGSLLIQLLGPSTSKLVMTAHLAPPGQRTGVSRRVRSVTAIIGPLPSPGGAEAAPAWHVHLEQLAAAEIDETALGQLRAVDPDPRELTRRATEETG